MQTVRNFYLFCKFPVSFRNYIIRFEELILFLSLESGYRKHLSEFPAFRNSAVRFIRQSRTLRVASIRATLWFCYF